MVVRIKCFYTNAKVIYCMTTHLSYGRSKIPVVPKQMTKHCIPSAFSSLCQRLVKDFLLVPKGLCLRVIRVINDESGMPMSKALMLQELTD